MKKFTKTICLLVLLGISAQAQAIDFNWGLKGGVNLSGSSYKGLAPNKFPVRPLYRWVSTLSATPNTFH